MHKSLICFVSPSTGIPRRKVHQTKLSGFKIFRPLTRDLLVGNRSPPSNINATKTSSSHHWRGVKDTRGDTQNIKSDPDRGSLMSPRKKTVTNRMQKLPDLLPRLLPPPKPSYRTKGGDSKTTFHLPEIVLSS